MVLRPDGLHLPVCAPLLGDASRGSPGAARSRRSRPYPGGVLLQDPAPPSPCRALCRGVGASLSLSHSGCVPRGARPFNARSLQREETTRTREQKGLRNTRAGHGGEGIGSWRHGHGGPRWTQRTEGQCGPSDCPPVSRAVPRPTRPRTVPWHRSQALAHTVCVLRRKEGVLSGKIPLPPLSSDPAVYVTQNPS